MILLAYSEGPDQTARIRRLSLVFAIHLCVMDLDMLPAGAWRSRKLKLQFQWRLENRHNRLNLEPHCHGAVHIDDKENARIAKLHVAFDRLPGNVMNR